MKKTIQFLALVSILVVVSNRIMANTPPNLSWKPLLELRELMKSSFHPMLKEDYAPAKANAALMLEKTKELVASTERPKEFRGKKKEAELQDLLLKAEQFASKVAEKATDEEIKIALSNFHGSFAGFVPEKMKKEMHKNEDKQCNH